MIYLIQYMKLKLEPQLVALLVANVNNFCQLEQMNPALERNVAPIR